MRCPDCARSTGGDCGKHVFPFLAVTDPSSIRIVSDYGPELRRIADALEQMARLLSGRVKISDLPDVVPNEFEDPPLPFDADERKGVGE